MPFDNRDLTGSFNTGGFITTVDQLDRAKSELGIGYVLGQRWTTGAPVTGTLAETALDYSLTIPGGLLGPNGLLRVTAFFGATNNANSKLAQIKLGGVGISGATLNIASSPAFGIQRHFANRGGEALNRWLGSSSNAAPFGGLSSIDTTIDTTVDQLLTFTATLSNVADQVWMAGVLVEVFPT